MSSRPLRLPSAVASWTASGASLTPVSRRTRWRWPSWACYWRSVRSSRSRSRLARARNKAAEKRAGAEAHLAELHSRMALEAVPAAAAAARPLAITVEDTLLFQGILQHIDPAAIRATCLAAGGETVEQVSGRVAALTTKLGAIAAAAAATATAAPPTVACALSGAAGAGMEPALAGVPCRAAAPACDAKGPAPPARGPAAEAGEGGDADGRSMWLDAEDQEELDQIVAELGVPRIPPEL